MSTKDSIVKKILVACCCSSAACEAAICYNCWTGTEACGLSSLHQAACFWTLCAPIVHDFKLGDVGQAGKQCGDCFKYALFGCALFATSSCDGVYNCVCYNMDNCKEGVSGFKDLLKHKKWLGDKVQKALGLATSNQPQKTFGTFKP